MVPDEMASRGGSRGTAANPHANRGLPAATAARATASRVTAQVSLRVPSTQYLGFSVVVPCDQFRKPFSPDSRQKTSPLELAGGNKSEAARRVTGRFRSLSLPCA